MISSCAVFEDAYSTWHRTTVRRTQQRSNKDESWPKNWFAFFSLAGVIGYDLFPNRQFTIIQFSSAFHIPKATSFFFTAATTVALRRRRVPATGALTALLFDGRPSLPASARAPALSRRCRRSQRRGFEEWRPSSALLRGNALEQD